MWTAPGADVSTARGPVTTGGGYRRLRVCAFSQFSAPRYNLMVLTATFHTDGPEATRGLGASLGRALSPGSCVLLSGALGAGKTTLAQGLARGLGVDEQVISPTFVLVREYDRPDGGRLIHIDFYRVSGAAEALDLGLEDYLGSNDIVVIEWPENVNGALPSERIRVSLELEGEPHVTAERRRIVIDAIGDAPCEALSGLSSAERLTTEG